MQEISEWKLTRKSNSSCLRDHLCRKTRTKGRKTNHRRVNNCGDSGRKHGFIQAPQADSEVYTLLFRNDEINKTLNASSVLQIFLYILLHYCKSPCIFLFVFTLLSSVFVLIPVPSHVCLFVCLYIYLFIFPLPLSVTFKRSTYDDLVSWLPLDVNAHSRHVRVCLKCPKMNALTLYKWEDAWMKPVQMNELKDVTGDANVWASYH